MPSNTQMTAKAAISILKGERARLKAQNTLLRYQEGRLARAAGGSPEAAETEVQDATDRVLAAYRYAEAALLCFKKQGKSAVKEATRQGLMPVTAPVTPAED